MKSKIYALADAVERVYESMDNSLNFPTDVVTEGAHITHTVTDADDDGSLFKDYRGVACPMNFVKVKIDLSTMATGDTLRIYLDDGPPIENVPRSVADEGHTIIRQEIKGDFWEVVIKKK